MDRAGARIAVLSVATGDAEKNAIVPAAGQRKRLMIRYPFIPPVVSPAMKYRWKMKKMRMIGIVAMTDPEMSIS